MPSPQAAIDSTTQQDFPQALALKILSDGKPPHPKARNRIPRQATMFIFRQLIRVNLRSTQCVVTKHCRRISEINENVDLRNVAPAVLGSAPNEIVI